MPRAKFRTKGGANVGVRLPPDLLEKLQHEADEQDVPMSSIVRRALRFYFGQAQPTVKPIQFPATYSPQAYQAGIAAAMAAKPEDGTP